MTELGSVVVRRARSVCTFAGEGPVRGGHRDALHVADGADVACADGVISAIERRL